MEITFTPGFTEKAETLLEEKKERDVNFPAKNKLTLNSWKKTKLFGKLKKEK